MGVLWEDVVDRAVQDAKAAGIMIPKIFPTGRSLDAALSARCADLRESLAKSWPPRYEPSLVEPLLGDVAALLNRCADYCRELSELEIAWVTQFLESSSRDEMHSLERELDLAGTNSAPLAVTTAGQRKAADALTAAAKKEPLAAGLALQAASASLTSAEMLKLADYKAERLVRRHALIAQHWSSLEARFRESGSAHNYLERYRRVLDLMLQDFDEGVEKAMLAAFGMREIFGVSEEWARTPVLDVPSSRGPLLDLVMWTRTAMRELERLAEREHEWELVVSLVQPWFEAKGKMLSPEEFKTTLSGGTTGEFPSFAVVIPDEIKSAHRRARIVAVGASLVTKDVSDATQSYRARVALIPPRLNLPDFVIDHDDQDHLQMWRRPTIVLGNVRPHAAGVAVDLSRSFSSLNVPFAASEGWDLSISPLLQSNTATAVPIHDAGVIDIRVHFLVVSEPEFDGIGALRAI